MTRTVRAVLVALVMALTACGGATDFEDVPGGPTATTTSVPSTAAPTTVAPVTTAGRTCASILTDGLKLANDFKFESRGVAGPPDEARFKASARVLADEAKRLGCPIPAVVEQFLRS